MNPKEYELLQERLQDQKMMIPEECKDCEWCREPKWKSYIRPAGFIITLGVFFFILFADGNWGKFTVREAYLPILETVLVTIVIALFASRGVEKTAKTWREGPRDSGYSVYRSDRYGYGRYQRGNYQSSDYDDEIPEIYRKNEE